MPLLYEKCEELIKPHRYVFTTMPCRKCGKQKTIEVNGPDLYKFNRGEGHLQNLFPYIDAGDREWLFQSGICGPCFDEVTKEEEEDENG